MFSFDSWRVSLHKNTPVSYFFINTINKIDKNYTILLYIGKICAIIYDGGKGVSFPQLRFRL